MKENGHEPQEHDKSLEILSSDHEDDYLDDEEPQPCPQCKHGMMYFNGMQQQPNGEWVFVAECDLCAYRDEW